MAHNELNEDYETKCKEIKSLNEQVSRLKKDIISIKTERDRFKMHKELLSKDFAPGKEALAKLVSKNTSSNSFNEVVRFREESRKCLLIFC